MSTQAEIRHTLAERVIRSLKNGTPPWRSKHNRGMPQNPLTGRKYTGINPLILDAVADKEHYRSKYWATYHQWHSLGMKVPKRPAHVQKGEWGINVVNWKSFMKGTQRGDNIRLDRFKLLHTYPVFNAEQCFGKECGKYLILNEAVQGPDYAQAEAVVTATKAVVRHHNKVGVPRYLRPPDDRIMLPSKGKFRDAAQYWSATFHELIHWTENKIGWLGSEDQGELIAEIASGYLESELGLPHDTDMTNHEKWLPTWTTSIEEDPKYLFGAAAQAARAVDYVFGFTRVLEREEDENVI